MYRALADARFVKANDISLALAAGKEAGTVIPLGAKVLEL